MKRLLIILPLLLVILALTGCRKQFQATEEDLANYGWEMFEAGRFVESNMWFLKSLELDSTYQDGYNGAAWSYGKMMDTENSSSYFQEGLNYTQSPYDPTDVSAEIKYGLCFIYNASGDDSLALFWGETLLTDWAEQEIQTWTFSHDTTLNQYDLYLNLASSYFVEGYFTESLEKVQTILAGLISTATFAPDVETVAGRNELADEIEYLQTLLSQP